MGALVWMALTMIVGGWPAMVGPVTVRPVAETMPWVTLSVRPYGLPIASTIAPMCALAESAQRSGFSWLAPWLPLMTARSSGVKTPTSLAFIGALAAETRTLNFLTVPTTWALVTMSPCRSKTTPEPVALPAVISTTEGKALVMVASSSRCSVDRAAPYRALGVHAATTDSTM